VSAKKLNIKRQLKTLLTGLAIPQEYACLALEEFQEPLAVFLTLKNQEVLVDVTQSHLFLGYKPLILAFTFNADDPNYAKINHEEQVCLSFTKNGFDFNVLWKNFKSSRGSLARMLLRKIAEKNHGNQNVLFFEGVYAEHSFLNKVHQFVNRQLEKVKTNNPNNVGLPGNLAEQVRIAYALPRLISIVTTSTELLMNMFPTDLHGPAGDKIYLGSLRIGGLANQQVEQNKKVVISEVQSGWYKQAYALGKNHMRELRENSNFSLHQEKSLCFEFPLPEAVTKYRELELIHSWRVGIHWIHHYEVVNQQSVQQPAFTLAHIHQYYAQWRLNHGLQTNILWR
jgi:hypothetical protein